MDSERGRRTSADLHHLAAGHGTTPLGSPASIGDILSDCFDATVESYYSAIDAERWDLVWRLGGLIDAIHRLAEREVER